MFIATSSRPSRCGGLPGEAELWAGWSGGAELWAGELGARAELLSGEPKLLLAWTRAWSVRVDHPCSIVF
jgi:hypothetical protein